MNGGTRDPFEAAANRPDHQHVDAGIPFPTHEQRPTPDGAGRGPRGIVVDADTHSAGIGDDIVDATDDRLAKFLAGEIILVHLVGLKYLSHLSDVIHWAHRDPDDAGSDYDGAFLDHDAVVMLLKLRRPERNQSRTTQANPSKISVPPGRLAKPCALPAGLMRRLRSS